MNAELRSGNRIWNRFSRKSAGASLISCLLLAVRSQATVVTNCTEADLRAAMAGGGEVRFECDGTIALSDTITIAQDTVLDGSGHQVTISGDNRVRIFYVSSKVSLTLSNLTIMKGSTDSIEGGGALFNSDGVVNATDCTFSENRAFGRIDTTIYPPWGYPSYGGAILNQSGLVNLRNCLFTQNGASSAFIAGPSTYGGALFNGGSMLVSHCRFQGNSVEGADAVSVLAYDGPSAGDGWGGAICNAGILSIEESLFFSNSVVGGSGGYVGGAGGNPGGSGGKGSGGAVYNSGLLAIQACTFLGNVARGGLGSDGGTGMSFMGFGETGGAGGWGGSANGGALFNEGTAVLVNSTCISNSARGGGGGAGGTGGETYSHPSAQGGNGGHGGYGGSAGGAGIDDASGLLQITNCTIASNESIGGTGGKGGLGGAGDPVQGPPGLPGVDGADGVVEGSLQTAGGLLVNTLVVSNVPCNCSGTVFDAGHNLSSDNSGGFTNTGSLNSTDPKLGPPADNGGPTLTMALLPGSPAIDAGDTAAAPATDQRGFRRPYGSSADIGAYEYGFLTIARPPLTQTVETGSTVDLCVDVDEYPSQTYQWFFNGTAIAPPTTNGCLELMNLDFSQIGAYTVVVTNIFGAVTSSPAMLNVIGAVDRRSVPALGLYGRPGTLLGLDYRDSLSPGAVWVSLDQTTLSNTPQFYLDLSEPLPAQRFYRAWQNQTPGLAPALDLHLVPEIRLAGSVGDSVRVDYINAIGPTDAWMTLDTVTLTNASQLYFDISCIDQPRRLYRLVPLP